MLILLKNYYIANRVTLLWSTIPVIILTALVYLIEHSTVFMVFIFTMVYISSFMQTEDKNKSDILYSSLPVKRTSIVYSRYISALILFVGIFLLSFLACSIIDGIDFPGRTGSYPVITVTGFSSIVIPIAVLVAGIFPFYFKYGYMKGLLLGTAASSVLSAAIVGILYVIIAINGNTTLLDAVMGKSDQAWITRFILGVFGQMTALMGKQNFLIFLSIVTIILVIASVKVSIKLYNNRDF